MSAKVRDLQKSLEEAAERLNVNEKVRKQARRDERELVDR